MTVPVPLVLDGLTLGQAIEVLGFTYQTSAIEKKPPRYGRKWLTARALRWRRRHRATIETILTLAPAP